MNTIKQSNGHTNYVNLDSGGLSKKKQAAKIRTGLVPNFCGLLYWGSPCINLIPGTMADLNITAVHFVFPEIQSIPHLAENP